MWILQVLHAHRAPRSLAVVCDSQAVAAAKQAGVGRRITERVGGQSGPTSGAPLVAEFTVRGLFDGKFTETQPTHGGFAVFDQGPTAVMTTDAGLTIVATTRRMAPFS